MHLMILVSLAAAPPPPLRLFHMSMLRLQLSHTFMKRFQLRLMFMRNLSSPLKLLELLTDPCLEQLQLPLLHNSLLPLFNNSNLSPNNNLSHNRLLLQYKACSPEPATTIWCRSSLQSEDRWSSSATTIHSSTAVVCPAPTGHCSSSTFYWNLHQPSW